MQEPSIDHELILQTRDRQNRLDQLIHDLADTLGLVARFEPKLKRYRFRAKRDYTLEQIRQEVRPNGETDDLKPGKGSRPIEERRSHIKPHENGEGIHTI
jgi:hypothetical protein